MPRRWTHFLRYEADQSNPEFKTYFRFGDQTILQHAEQCNGSGDCRKTQLSGGTMCPSFMATRNEKETTRARANILREMLTRSPKDNRFDHEGNQGSVRSCAWLVKAAKANAPATWMWRS